MIQATKDTIYTFKRYEKKYLLSKEKYDAFMDVADAYLEPDVYYKSLVCSIYYDSDDFELIRHSIESPVYKEKLRLRSYGVPSDDSAAFVELKKKYKGVVYKRRVEMTAAQAQEWLAGGRPPEESQITREIDWFLKMNDVSPKVFIGCDRTSYVAKDDPELRITIDSGIRWRDSDLLLQSGDCGQELLEEDQSLMEIKMPEAAPLWLARLLSNEEIFPTTYSKYGTCYKTEILRKEDA